MRNLTAKHALGKKAEAAQSFMQESFPDDPMIQSYDGVKSLREGKFEEAGKIFEQLIGKSPEELHYHIGKFRSLMANGNYKEALEAIQASPGSKEQIAPLEALAWIKLKQPDEAEAAFQIFQLEHLVSQDIGGLLQ